MTFLFRLFPVKYINTGPAQIYATFLDGTTPDMTCYPSPTSSEIDCMITKSAPRDNRLLIVSFGDISVRADNLNIRKEQIVVAESFPSIWSWEYPLWVFIIDWPEGSPLVTSIDVTLKRGVYSQGYGEFRLAFDLKNLSSLFGVKEKLEELNIKDISFTDRVNMTIVCPLGYRLLNSVPTPDRMEVKRLFNDWENFDEKGKQGLQYEYSLKCGDTILLPDFESDLLRVKKQGWIFCMGALFSVGVSVIVNTIIGKSSRCPLGYGERNKPPATGLSTK
jgi:hypothetical protein